MKVILFLLCAQFAFAQQLVLQKESVYPLEATTFVGVDKFGFVYYINRNTLYKKKDDTLYEYRDIQLGRIASVDLTNPLQLVLFFREANALLILDNRLNERKRIKFDTLREQRNIDFASLANEQSVWLFNIDNQELEIYDFNRDKNIINSLPVTKEVIQMQSNFNFCYLLLEDELHIYNSYGSVLEKLHFQLTDFVMYKNDVLGFDNQQFWYINNKSKPQKISIPDEIKVVNFHLNHQNLYIYDGKNVHNYKITTKK
jgi:hypothetical protein